MGLDLPVRGTGCWLGGGAVAAAAAAAAPAA